MTFNLDAFERAKKASVAQLLFKCGRLLNEGAIERIRKLTHNPKLRLAHTSVFPHIDFEGTRQTELASRMGVSKQAVGQLIAELEEMGMLEKVADPRDGRAKLIRYSEQGKIGLIHGLGVLAEIEKELSEKMGEKTMANLHAALLSLEQVLTQQDKNLPTHVSGPPLD